MSVPGLVRLVRQTEPKHEHLRNLIRGVAQEILLWGCSLAGSRPRSGVGFAGEERGKEKMKSLKWNYKTITMPVAHCYGVLPRPCAATGVRDDTMDFSMCAGCGHSRACRVHLSRRNVHVSYHVSVHVSLDAPESFTELVRASGDRGGHTVMLKPRSRTHGANANEMAVVLQHGGAPRNRRCRRRGRWRRSRRQRLPLQPLAQQSEYGTERRLHARRRWQVAWRDQIPTFCT